MSPRRFSQDLQEDSIPRILEFFNLATEHDSLWYKAWHAWALNNFEAVLYYKLKLAAVTSGGGTEDADGSLNGAEGGDLVSNGSSVASPPGCVCC